MPAANVVVDQTRPSRLGNTTQGMLSGTFTDTATGATLYTDALAIVTPRFLPTPPPRIVVMANTVTNGYSFIAIGRAV